MVAPLAISNPAIAPGSWVLVTGCNGLIGSHCVDQFIAAGYKVRGTVRDVSRSQWMVEYFQKKYGSGQFELAEVKDFTEPGCFDGVVKGMSAVAHTTYHFDLNATDPNPAIPLAIKTVITALESAAREPGIKRVVLTSSAWAAASPRPDVEFSIDRKSWNEEAVKAAWSKDPLPKGFDVYMAAKTQAEQEAWKWYAEHKPSFVLNTILPDTVFGSILEPSKQGIPSTAGMLRMLFEGQNLSVVQLVQPQWFVDVVDTARLHVAALVEPSVKDERILGYAEPWNWNDVLAIFRKYHPDRKFVDDLDLGRDVSKVANSRGEKLLKKLWGTGWTSLDESVRNNVSSIIETAASLKTHSIIE